MSAIRAPFLPGVLAAAAALGAAGCRALPSGPAVRQSIATGEVDGSAVVNVPFVEQGPIGCGPAALAAVLRHHGLDASPDRIRDGELVPSSLGTYTYELAMSARRAGLFARDLRMVCDGEPTAMRRLLELLDAKLPVIVLLRRGPPLFTTYHYVAVTGYDDTRGLILYQDGLTPDAVDDYDSFQDDWHAGDHWALVVFPPEKHFEFLSAADHVELAGLCDARGSFEASLAHHEAALRETPDDPVAAVGAAGALSRLGRNAEAAAAFERCIELNPDDARALNNFAGHLLRSGGDLARAEALARRAIDASPELRPYTLDTLGRVLAARGDVDGARAQLAAALASTRPDQERLRGEIEARLSLLR